MSSMAWLYRRVNNVLELSTFSTLSRHCSMVRPTLGMSPSVGSCAGAA